MWSQYLAAIATSEEVIEFRSASRLPRARALAHLLLRTTNLPAAEKLHIDCLGLTVRTRETTGNGRPLVVTDQGLGLTDGRPDGDGPVEHIAFEVRNLTGLVERLEESGVMIRPRPNEVPTERRSTWLTRTGTRSNSSATTEGSPMETEARALRDEVLTKMCSAMEEHGLDVLVPMSPENLAYASGAAPPSQRTVRSRLAAGVIPLVGETEVITIALEGPLVETQSRLDKVTTYEEFVDNPVEVVASSLSSRGLAEARIGIEETYLSVETYRTLRRALPNAIFEPIDELLRL